MTGTHARVRKAKLLIGPLPVLAWVVRSITSQVYGWTWMRENDISANQNCLVGRRPRAGGPVFARSSRLTTKGLSLFKFWQRNGFISNNPIGNAQETQNAR